MALTLTRLYGDKHGDTHFEVIEVKTADPSSSLAVDLTELAVTTALWVDYPAGQPEIMPGFHESPTRHLHVCVRGRFEVTTTSGTSKIFEPGDVLLCDDLDSKGHVTKGVGEEPRVALVLSVDDSWVVPRAEGQPGTDSAART